MTDSAHLIDLSALPAPTVVEPLSYEEIYNRNAAAYRAQFVAIHPGQDWDPTNEADAAVIDIQQVSEVELQMRQRINDAARALLLAYAQQTDLTHLAANHEVARLVVDPGDATAVPPRPAVLESDDRLRRRVQLSWSRLSTAGPRRSYIYHALSASPLVADADADSPAPCEVVVVIMSTAPDGTADASLLDTVLAALSDEDRRPTSEELTVVSAQPVPYSIDADLEVSPGPDREVVRAASEASAAAYATAQRRLGEPVTLDGVYKALRVAGVRRVRLISPAADIDTGWTEFPALQSLRVGLLP
ncbi:baseplate assembly protein [Novispirillum itersonii]|uniref:baseplate assembly protein n=1 Tax=Novispirillum itersonii TaxID=189 RepID=UPI000362335C|nr:baseplate J/gp47 family protein [Novispirillum itersonii]